MKYYSSEFNKTDFYKRKPFENNYNMIIPSRNSPWNLYTISIGSLEKTLHPKNTKGMLMPPPFRSWMELKVLFELIKREYSIIPAYPVDKYEVDLAIIYPGTKIAIEYDGSWHSSGEQPKKDKKKDTHLQQNGWKIFRIREAQWEEYKDAVIQKLIEFLSFNNVRKVNDYPPETINNWKGINIENLSSEIVPHNKPVEITGDREISVSDLIRKAVEERIKMVEEEHKLRINNAVKTKAREWNTYYEKQKKKWEESKKQEHNKLEEENKELFAGIYLLVFVLIFTIIGFVFTKVIH